MTKYGMPTAVFDEMLASQNGLCAICEEKLVNLRIDHDHVTGRVRGLLCHPCNIKLAAVEDQAFLTRATQYLSRDT